MSAAFVVYCLMEFLGLETVAGRLRLNPGGE